MTASPGVAVDQIKIGVRYSVTRRWSVSAVVGNEAADAVADQLKATYQALFEEIDADGGLAGRMIVPMWSVYDYLKKATPEVQDQEACSRLTEVDCVVRRT